MTRFRIVPDESTVRIDARSSVHPLHGEADDLEGYLDVELADGQVDLSQPVAMRFEVPVDRLRSGNPLYDDELQRRLDARKFPTIVGEARQVSEGGSMGRYRARGDVTVRGVTRTFEGELRVTTTDQQTLVVEGEEVFDIRDFNLEPPRILLLRVYPEVKVSLRLVAAQDGQMR
jgi:polyisoprenoid-binding protein YceI